MYKGKARSGKGKVLTFAVSVLSLMGVHLAIAIAHEWLNHASPDQEISYALDRGMEQIELGWSRLSGANAEHEKQLLLAEERLEEFEHLLEAVNDPAHAKGLLEDMAVAVARASALTDAAAPAPDDIQAYKTALMLSSTAAHIRDRLTVLRDAGISSVDLTDTIDRLAAVASHVNEQLAVFTIDESAAATVQEEVSVQRTQRQARASSSSAPPAAPREPAASACGAKNEACAANADCCSGLACQSVTTSDGPQRRCMPLPVTICEVRCADDEWTEPRGCVPSASTGLPRCEDLTGEACDEGRGGRELTRSCLDS